MNNDWRHTLWKRKQWRSRYYASLVGNGAAGRGVAWTSWHSYHEKITPFGSYDYQSHDVFPGQDYWTFIRQRKAWTFDYFSGKFKAQWRARK